MKVDRYYCDVASCGYSGKSDYVTFPLQERDIFEFDINAKERDKRVVFHLCRECLQNAFQLRLNLIGDTDWREGNHYLRVKNISIKGVTN